MIIVSILIGMLGVYLGTMPFYTDMPWWLGLVLAGCCAVWVYSLLDDIYDMPGGRWVP